MENTKIAIETFLGPLIGRGLSIARNAGNLKGLHFGEPISTEEGLVGQYALHIHCPWRMEHDGQIVTGWSDYFELADNNLDEDWDPESGEGNLQDQILGDLLQGYDLKTKSITNQTNSFIVTEVSSDALGGVHIHFTGNYQLVVFPCGTRGEYWRLLEPNSESPHFVVEANLAHFE